MYRRSPNPYSATGVLIVLVAGVWAFGPVDAPDTAAESQFAQQFADTIPEQPEQHDPQQVPGAQEEQECQATFQPESIEAGTVHEEVHVTFTEPIQHVEDVEVDEESGLNVLWTHDDDDDLATAARVRVSAVGAQEGTWRVTFEDEAGKLCEGRITVTGGN